MLESLSNHKSQPQSNRATWSTKRTKQRGIPGILAGKPHLSRHESLHVPQRTEGQKGTGHFLCCLVTFCQPSPAGSSTPNLNIKDPPPPGTCLRPSPFHPPSSYPPPSRLRGQANLVFFSKALVTSLPIPCCPLKGWVQLQGHLVNFT